MIEKTLDALVLEVKEMSPNWVVVQNLIPLNQAYQGRKVN